MNLSTKLYCQKLDCKFNVKTSNGADAGICQKATLLLEEYPSKDRPAACADYQKEGK